LFVEDVFEHDDADSKENDIKENKDKGMCLIGEIQVIYAHGHTVVSLLF